MIKLKTKIVPTVFGEMEIFEEDTFVGRSLEHYGFYSQGETKLFANILHEGSIAIEAGANIGSLTVPMARMVGKSGRIIAFEPQPENAFLLLGNIRRNGLLDQVWVRQAACGRERGVTTIPYLEELSLNNFGMTETGKGHCVVAVEAIDDLDFLPRVDFMKLDVEGNEREALLGAESIISTYRPIIYFENDRPDKKLALYRLVHELGYRMYQHVTWLQEGSDRNLWDQSFASLNILALPDESPIKIADQPQLMPPDFDEPIKDSNELKVRAEREKNGICV